MEWFVKPNSIYRLELPFKRSLLDTLQEKLVNYSREEWLTVKDPAVQFVNTIIEQKDFVKAYVFGENNENAWIIIKDTSLENHLKYMRLYREFNSDDFSIILFEEDEEEDILEQLKYSNSGYEGYKVYGK